MTLRRLLFLLAALPSLLFFRDTAYADASSEAVMKLAHDYWEHFLENHPLDATQIGDRRYNDRSRRLDGA